MPNGSPPRAPRGFTYVAMLVAVAVLGVGLVGTAEVWSLSHQREKEDELLFVGNQYRQAIGRYYQATPGGGKRYPERLEDLLEDNRYPMPLRHLRKLYADPLTGRAEWGLIQAPGGGIMGIYSMAGGTPLKQAEFRYVDQSFQGAPSYSEWRFFYEPPLVAPPAR
jgi:type II secretory pathway pseudopilin PulG